MPVEAPVMRTCFPERDGMKLRSDFGFFILLKILVARIINEMPRVVQTAKANIMLENGNIDRQQVSDKQNQQDCELRILELEFSCGRSKSSTVTRSFCNAEKQEEEETAIRSSPSSGVSSNPRGTYVFHVLQLVKSTMEKPASDRNIALARPKKLQKTADDFQSQKKQTTVSLQIYGQLLSRFDVLDPGSAAKIAHEFQTKKM
jgi:hypothetical protein